MKASDFESHFIWQRIADLQMRLNDFSDAAKADERFHELWSKLSYIEWVFRQSDSDLFSRSDLNSTKHEFDNLDGALIEDCNSWSNHELVNEQFSRLIARFPYPRKQKIFKSEAKDMIDEVRMLLSQVSQDVSSAKARASSIESDLASFSDAVETVESKRRGIESRFDSLWESFKTESASHIEDMIATMQRKLEASDAERNSRLSEQVDSAKSQVSEAQRLLSDLKKGNEEVIRASSEQLKASQTEIKKEADGLLGQIRGVYEQAGQIALSGGFTEAAHRERDSYRAWSNFASVAFVLAAVVLAIMFFSAGSGRDIDISFLLTKVPVSAILVLPALYFSGLAAKHRRTAIELQSLGLRIKAFDAYLALAEVNQREELRMALARTFFEKGPEDRDAWRWGVNREKIVDRVAGILEQAIDKVGGGK